jgi:hypothetical protein
MIIEIFLAELRNPFQFLTLLFLVQQDSNTPAPGDVSS